MPSSKRSYSSFEDKNEFQYNINNGIIEFYKLFMVCEKNTKHWKVYITLYNSNGYKENIDLSMLDIINSITNTFNNYYCEIVTEYGVVNMKTTISKPTIITIGKNINKKNETNIITQSLIVARNLFLKKISAGYNYKNDNEYDNIKLKRFYPMAVQTYTKYKNKITYPVYIQPKIDGIRMTAHIEIDNVKVLSRRLKDIYGFDFMYSEIKKIINGILSFHDCNIEDIYIDGELYNHNYNLQKISGIVRNENNENNEKEELQFHIFDYFIANDKVENLIFHERIKNLQNIFSKYDFTYCNLLETIIISNEEESNDIFQKFITNGYEGIIYKNINAKYEWSDSREKRSMLYIKRKKQFDNEYKIVGYSTGNGKFNGMAIFTLETETGLTFNSVPNGSAEYRKGLYLDCLENFETKYLNKYCKIVFDEFSKDNIPLRSNIVQIIRDLDFD